ncbi:minor capsid protein [Nonomuraea rhizosphaerae]|uniref:minor capsid protein n=1 Tax=Nonomuraea rhizosphaerae TaxID=2665663 RepID=UPI001C5FBF16|nr:minor capsid protein [Nonomuraea rhizosphaerae]
MKDGIDVKLDMHLNVAAFDEETKTVAARALKDAALHVLQVSNMRVPLQEGHLQNSGDTSVDRSALRAAVSYSQPYAVRQHEELTWKHAPGREAKYLETALEEEAHAVQALLAQQLKELFR